MLLCWCNFRYIFATIKNNISLKLLNDIKNNFHKKRTETKSKKEKKANAALNATGFFDTESKCFF